jgi:tryptophan 2,3-dioxygenase
VSETEHRRALTYSSYLCLDELLAAQRPRSDEHDELLFIVVHQVYELWFKQLLHEFAALQRRLEDGNGPHALHTLGRVRAILKTIVAEIDVLETMTPRQFSGFRRRLESASGFQSAQFRELEAVLGRRDPSSLDHYPADGDAHSRIAAAFERPPVYESFLRYLVAHGYDAGGVPDVLLDVYRDEGEPAQVCEALVDIDEGLQEWRYRHVKMVERTIGTKAGTGGSDGAEYLRRTLFQPVFPDLWAIRSRM